MTINHTTHGTVDVVELPEQLVMANAPETREALQNLINEGHHKLVLDLKAISFIDSSGLSVLVSTMKAVHAEDGAVVLLNPTAGVRSLIELTRLHLVFDIFEDRDAAIQQLA
jgi:anti-sigma B factor antagonist